MRACGAFLQELPGHGPGQAPNGRPAVAGRRGNVEQIVELGWYAGQVVDGHRFIHMLDALGDAEPIVGLPATATG